MKLDVEFINTFLEATMKVLEIQASTKATPGQVALKQDDQNLGDISGVIGITSDAFNGSVVICFPANTFLKVIGRMLGEEYNEITKDIIDGASELTNIIFGQAKVSLNQKGYGIKMAIPSVIVGKDHHVYGLAKGPVVMLPFTTDIGPFYVEIAMAAPAVSL